MVWVKSQLKVASNLRETQELLMNLALRLCYEECGARAQSVGRKKAPLPSRQATEPADVNNLRVLWCSTHHTGTTPCTYKTREVQLWATKLGFGSWTSLFASVCVSCSGSSSMSCSGLLSSVSTVPTVARWRSSGPRVPL